MNLFKKVSVCALCVLSCPAFSSIAKENDNKPFPESLFEIKLGATYKAGKAGSFEDIGTFPVKEFAGAQGGIGYGTHYYFRPLKDYKAFDYIEKRKNPKDKYFETSFRLYLWPIIPISINKTEELSNSDLKWQVALVEWSDSSSSSDKSKAYYWAQDQCENVRVDLNRKPEIINYYEDNWYACTFSEGEKQLKIEGHFGSKFYRLSYIRAVSDKREKVIETSLRKLNMKDIKPY